MKWILILLACFSLCACATYPSPRVENGRYIHAQYEFSFSIPEGWKMTTEVPDWIVPHVGDKHIEVMFFNQETTGGILICTDKTVVHALWISSERLEAAVQDAYAKHSEKVKSMPYIKSYSFQVYSPGYCYRFMDCKGPHGCLIMCRMATEYVSAENEMIKTKGEAETYYYTCQKDDTCSISIGLFSLEKTFDENRQVYEAVLRSLRSEN